MEILTRHCVDGIWQSTWNADAPRDLFSFPQPEPEAFLLEKIRHYEKAVPLQVHFQLIPNPVGKSRETSVFPYLLLVVEPKSGMVLGVQMLSVENQPHGELIASVPTELLRICDKNAVRPASLAVISPATHALLVKTAAALGIPCDLDETLPALDHAFQSMMGAMGGGM